MPYLVEPAELLRDPEVERFFLTVLESDRTAEEKYARFIEFFESNARISRQLLEEASGGEPGDPEEPDRLLAAAAERAGVWQPSEILQAVEESLSRAVARLHESRHEDGGWGYRIEESSVWATAWAVRFLDAAREEGFAGRASRDLAQDGFEWLLGRRDEWSVESVPPHGGAPVYDATLVMRCAYHTGRDRRPEVAEVLAGSLDALVAAQNDDGGWDAKVWGPEPLGETGCWSDVGATSAVIRTLVLARRPDLRDGISKGAEGLLGSQRPDGGWPILFSEPEAVSVNKTCDGLKGLLAAGGAGIELETEPYRGAIRKAAAWLRERERPVEDQDRGVRGWGWTGSDQGSAVENTCLILETLVEVPAVPLPLLASNALWLIEAQLRKPGSPEDGDWPNKDTARIALSLLHFYRKIRESPLFGTTSHAPP